MILAVDQGTTGTTCLVVDDELAVRGRGYRELPQHFPRPGWVEHDPEEIWRTVEEAAAAALADAGVRAQELRALGITNQRETAVLWERSSGRPAGRAIVWQDRRTARRCAELPAGELRRRTGLVPDPYFSATKLEWMLRERGRADGLAFGTVESWLVWKLTGGRAHLTDVTNASRTLLANLATGAWDETLLDLFGVEPALLPRIVPSSGELAEGRLLGASVPICGLAGDQQAALFAHRCFRPGEAKATYGTGSFVLAQLGSSAPSPPPPGLLATAAAQVHGGEREYALEGAVFVTGAAVSWLRDGLGILASAAESEALARALAGNDGVYFVPALTGLGAPHWAPDARGLVCGLTRGSDRRHLARAALEAIAYQTRDVVDAMGLGLQVLRADGGATANGFLMQFQADLLGIPVEVAADAEMTALGAAALAGLGAGVWRSRDELPPGGTASRRFEPRLSPAAAEDLHAGWRDALARALADPSGGATFDAAQRG